MARRALWFVLCLIFIAVACAPTEMAYLGALLRFTNHGPTVLLISMPKQVRVATIHPTLAGQPEATVESRTEPIDLTQTARLWADNIGRSLAIYQNLDFVTGQPADKRVMRLAADPRRDGEPGYRLLQLYRPEPPAHESLGPKLPSEADLDDPTAARCLVRAEVPVDNLPKPLWYGFDPHRIAESFSADYMLLVALDHVTVVDTGARPKVTYRIGARLIDLTVPLIAADFTIDLDGSRVEGPGGIDASLCTSLAELKADDWAALRNTLKPLAERYGAILATQMGWISQEHLVQIAQTWAEENERLLKARNAQ